jgi:hypothetical protein
MAEGSVTEIAELARIRVLAGGEPQETTFQRGRPSRLMIGSDPAATLRIARSDVAPRQLDLIWDGAQLWLQDGLRLGRTFVNGRTLNEWMPIVGQAIVCFGGVRLWMVAHTTPPRLPSPDFAALDRARLSDVHHSAGMRLKDTGRFTLAPEVLALIERDVP